MKEKEEIFLENHNIKFTRKGKNYLKENSIDIKEHEYAIGCYKLTLLDIFSIFKNDLGSLEDFITLVKEGEEKSLCGSGGCMTCPFSCGEEAEIVQNYACLPDASNIIRMKEISGHNWGCHSDETKLCGGMAKRIKDFGLDLNVNDGGLISYNDWYHLGEEEALKRALINSEKKI